MNVITPYGRMGLTNYEMREIISSFLFSVWGLDAIFGIWRVTEVFMLGIIFYIMQAIMSHFWLKYFLYGLLE